MNSDERSFAPPAAYGCSTAGNPLRALLRGAALLVLLCTTQLRAEFLRLDWTDNSIDELGFRIERAEGNGAFVLIHTTLPDVTTYQDDITPGVAYRYHVYAYNLVGDSAPTNVVTNAVTIATQPVATQTITAFTTATFTVVASGIPAPTYQWRKGTTSLTNGGNISGATSATLTLTNVRVADAGTYSVVVSNPIPSSVTSAPAELIVNKANQTIDFATLNAKTFGDASFPVTATATSGLPVTLSVISGSAAFPTNPALSGSNLTVTSATPSSVTIRASQDGNADYNAATSVDRSFSVAKASQTVSVAINPAGPKTFRVDPPFTVSTTATSGLTPALGMSGPATLAGNTVTLTGAGTVTFTASLAESANYLAASSAPLIIGVDRSPQTITFAALAPKAIGAQPFALTASSDSGLAITYTSSDLNVATVSGDTVTIIGTGTTTITASQPGNQNFRPATSVSRDLLVGGTAPTFTAQPSSKTIAPTGSTSFTVAASGNPTPTIQWERSTDGGGTWIPLANDSVYSGVTTATLGLTNVPLGFNGYRYRAVASNGVIPNATSSVAILTMDANAPLFTTQPANVAVNLGTSATFTVAASGTPAPAYQWQLSTDGGTTFNDVPAAAPYTGVTSATLTIAAAPIGLSNNRYRAIATNTLGSATSSAAVLTVNGVAPSFTTHPASQTLAAGATATFTVVVTGTPTPTIQWRKNGVNIAGATAPTLTVSNISSADTGTYTVLASNGVNPDAVSNGAVLTLSAPPPPPPPPPPPTSFPPPPATSTVAPSFAVEPADQTANAGATVTFTALAGGSPAPTIQWRRNGVAISGATGSSLVLNNVSAADVAAYTATATNSAGTATSREATLQFNTPPVITSQPVSQTVRAGETAVFSVDATGVPAPSFQWRRDGASLGGATGSTLTLENVQTTQAGSYDVVVSNGSGTVTSNPAVLAVNLPSYAGTYFGDFAGGGSWALYVRADNTATYIANLPDRGTAIVLTLAVNADGTFSVTGTELAPPTTSSTLGTPPIAAAANTFVLSGSIRNGQVTGQLAGLDKTLSGSAIAPTGPAQAAAGFYTAAALGTTSATTYSIVGANGRAVAVTAGAGFADGAAGTVAANGELTTRTNSGAQLSLAIDPQARTIAVAYTSPGASAPVNFAGVPDTTAAVANLINLSVRSTAGADSDTLIVGFVVTGPTTKSLLVRGVGPTLRNFGLATALSDPILTLFAGSSAISSNDDWGSASNPAQIVSDSARVGAFPLAADSRDSVLLLAAESRLYSVHLTGKAGSGIGLIELYDAAAGGAARLANVSARTRVGTGDDALIVGFVVSGNVPRQLLIRGVGPGLAAFGVSDVLQDPELNLFRGSDALHRNDNWGGTATLAEASSQVGAFPLQSGSRDAILLVTLQPGAYSAVLSGVGNTTGVALVELYEVR